MGSSAASAECLRAILREGALQVVGVVTQPDRPAGRGKTLTPCPCAQFAAANGITEIIKPENVNAEEPMARIRAWRPDVVAVVAYGQILKKPLLELPLFGCVNCHFSLLPKYRGAAPVIASLLSGDRMTGVTVMHMGEGLDDGPIMLQSYEPIYPDTTGGALMDDLAVAGGVALAKALKLLSSNQLPPEVPQDHENATYVKKLRKSDGLLDWNLPALELERQGIQADVVVVDPPRKGLNGDTIEALSRFAPRRIVYVSCDPATLARDVALLKDRGYQVKNALAADLFPRCSHVESIVCLVK